MYIFIFEFLKDNGKEHVINKLQNETELLTKELDGIKASVLETARVSERQVIRIRLFVFIVFDKIICFKNVYLQICVFLLYNFTHSMIN